MLQVVAFSKYLNESWFVVISTIRVSTYIWLPNWRSKENKAREYETKFTASTYGLGQITIPTHTSTVQRMNGKCLLFYLRPVRVFVRLVESFLITFDVKFIYFRGFCPVMFPGPHVL